jgi:hypothetical protein
VALFIGKTLLAEAQAQPLHLPVNLFLQAVLIILERNLPLVAGVLKVPQ